MSQRQVRGVPTSVPPPDRNTRSDSHPIKGNTAGRQATRPVDPIYHVPGSRYYAVTDPEECFATAADAEAAGYRASGWRGVFNRVLQDIYSGLHGP